MHNISLSKDRARRLDRKYKPPFPAEVEEAFADKELEALKRQETRAARKAQLTKERIELTKRIANHMVDEAMHCFKTRTELFSDGEKLLKFLENVIPVEAPSLWIDFKNYCVMHDYCLADAVLTAVGGSTDYETQLTNPNETRNLLEYFKSVSERA